jgi:poly-gamma-glutamate capsule biosynthesis protein CapA/YwtB (metallophosphatase superfamily)
MDAETMKSVLDVFVELENKGILVKEHKVELSKTKDGNDIVNWMDVQIAAKIEKQFVARKALAEEWLDDNCTDERKEVIEIEIHKINQYVADLLGIEYQMND